VSIVDQIQHLRDIGVVRCGYLERAATLMEVAQEFSLNDDNANYHTISLVKAEETMARLLHQDMAYNSEIMAMEQAWNLAVEFLRYFNHAEARFYTNIDFGTIRQTGPDSWAGPQWNPVTNATFDAGVIAIDPKRAACFWVEDED
jgi:hypothetical protein